jgi:hypothetical protein
VPTRPIARRVLAAIFLAHVVASAFVIDPAALLTDEPFWADDYPLHFARGSILAAELPRTWRLWAYDPGTLAGYPLGATIFDLDNVGTPVVMALLPLSPARAFKMLVVLCLLGAPLVIWSATRRLGGDDDEALAAAAAASVVAATAFTLRLGMFTGFAVAYLSVLVVALAAAHLRAPTARSFLVLVVVGSFGLLLHVLLGVLVVLPCAILSAFAAVRAPGRTLAQAYLLAATLLVLAAPWVVPFLRLAPDVGWHYPHRFWETGPLAAAWGSLTILWGWPLVLLAASVVGLWVWRRRMSTALLVAYGAWVLVLLVTALQGSRLPILASLLPLRMMLPLSFALCPLAGAGVVALLRRVSVPQLAPLVFVPHLVVTLARLAPLPALHASLPPEGHAFVAWVRELTDPDARFVVEDRLHLERPRLDRDVPDHPYFGGHLPALLPALTGREAFGGPYPEMPIRVHRADLVSGVLLGTPLAEWPSDRLAAALTRYNVGTIVVWSSVARERLAAASDVVTPAGQLGYFHAFRTRQAPSWLLVGSGSVRARPNAIEVTDASPGGVVLKYHWYPGLCSDPPLPVRPHEAPDLAAPFIAVDNGDVRAFTIRPTRDWRGDCR